MKDFELTLIPLLVGGAVVGMAVAFSLGMTMTEQQRPRMSMEQHQDLCHATKDILDADISTNNDVADILAILQVTPDAGTAAMRFAVRKSNDNSREANRVSRSEWARVCAP